MGCSDDAETNEPLVYDDPAGDYTPPHFRSSKTDDVHAGPTIQKVSWRSLDECSVESISSVEITVEIESGHHPIESLRIEGAVTGCNGTISDYGPMIASTRNVITCHNVTEHEGMVTVVDEDGQGDSLFFQFDACQPGHAAHERADGP